MQIRFQPDAEAELAEARVWYGLQRDGLDAALMLRIDETLQRIVEAPNAYPIVYRQLRRAVIRQFPFAIFYEPIADEIRVLAVYHLREAKARQNTGKPFAGIVYAHQLNVNVGQCIADLELIAHASDPSEWLNQTVYLPL